jgi:hypothetical protein
MKIEFLKRGSPDCPLIRLFEFNVNEAYGLRRIALQLAGGKQQSVALHEVPGVIPIGGCQLRLDRGEKDRGAHEVAPLKFDWMMTNDGWRNVAGLIRPFSRGTAGGWQWLSSIGKIAVLLSRDGSW